MNRSITIVLALVIFIAGYFFLFNLKSGVLPISSEQTGSSTQDIIFHCSDGKTIDAYFGSRGAVGVDLSDLRTRILLQIPSSSGERYESTTTGTHFILLKEGNNISLTENGHITYKNCIAAN